MEVKERITVKANELFLRYGIRSVSMDDIAAELGMSKKTLYQYYADKEEIIHEVFDAVFAENRHYCSICKQEGENVIHEVFLSFDHVQEMLSQMNPALVFDMKKYHPAVFQKFHEFKYNFLYKMLKENLEKGVKEELYREDIDIEILVRFRLHSIMLSFEPEAFPGLKTPLIQIERSLMEHFLYGIATAKGQKLITKYKNQRLKK